MRFRLKLRALARRTVSLLCGLAVGVAITYAVAAQCGYRFFVEMTGSMAPVLPVGSVIVSRPEPGTQVKVGQIVTFVAPDHSGRLITHRVYAVVHRNGKTGYRTKGDANPAVDSWIVQFPQQVGVTRLAIPWAGYGLYALSLHLGRVLLIAFVAAVLVFQVVARLWRDELAALRRRRRVRKDGIAA